MATVTRTKPWRQHGGAPSADVEPLLQLFESKHPDMDSAPLVQAFDLASYAQGNGFDWTYAVMSNELLAGLADEFGRSITSAPSTPHFIIHPDGTFTELSTGIHSAEEIIAQIQDAQS